MSEWVLEARGVVRTYGDAGAPLTVLNGVDLALPAGAQVAITGVSGCGKSTLLHVLGGLDTPTRGSVAVDGKDFARLGAGAQGALRNRALGFVYQFHHLLAELSALENVALPLLMGRSSPAQAKQRAGELLDRVGLSQRLSHKPGQLSGGERQRVAIARALVTQPRVVLADEPTGNLDPHTAQQVFDLLVENCALAGGALVVVTHNADLAARLPMRRVLQDGRLVSAD